MTPEELRKAADLLDNQPIPTKDRQVWDPKRHTPSSHVEHKLPNCGCWTGGDVYLLCKCGAAYGDEVLSFSRWRCYDCSRMWYTIQAAYSR